MEGPVQDRGVNLRALETVMELSASALEEYSTVVHVSMLEVYNEKIRWLLVFMIHCSKGLLIQAASNSSPVEDMWSFA